MDIRIDGIPYNWTIKRMAAEAKVTPMTIVNRLRSVGAYGIKPEGRILFNNAQADAVIHWDSDTV